MRLRNKLVRSGRRLAATARTTAVTAGSIPSIAGIDGARINGGVKGKALCARLLSNHIAHGAGASSMRVAGVEGARLDGLTLEAPNDHPVVTE